MENIRMTELLCRGFEAYESELYAKIKANAEYQKAQEIYSKHINTLKPNNSYAEIDRSATTMETVAKDIAFDEGFKLGVRLMISCMSSCKEV